MRQLCHLPEPDARRFADYLYAQGVDNEVEREPDGAFAIWVAADEELPRATALLAEFNANPTDPKFAAARDVARERRQAVSEDNEAAERRVFNRRRLFVQFGSHGIGPVTFVLLAACVWVAILSKLGTVREPVQSLFISWEERVNRDAPRLPEVRRGEAWRVFSPALLHFGAMHLLGNSMWLFSLGSMIEASRGSGRFTALVLLLAAGSNLAQYSVDGPSFGGMSGVVFGLFGYAWMRGKFLPGGGVFVTDQERMIMLVWFFICFTGAVGPIANTAHASGLALGMALGWWSARRGLRAG
jgi:GlpG protein